MIKHMEIATIVGLAAAALTTIAFLPQAIKAWKTKSTKDLSLNTFIMFWAGVACWLAYGLMINDLPIIVANIVTIILATAILAIKLKYK